MYATSIITDRSASVILIEEIWTRFKHHVFHEPKPIAKSDVGDRKKI